MDKGKLLDELERDEKLMLEAYDDATGKVLRSGATLVGNLTIGIGHNLNAKKISKGAAYYIYHDDIEDVEADLDHRLPWWRGLCEVRQRVFANMCFNLGIARLLEFEHMLAYAMISQFEKAADELTHSRWYTQVGMRARRLEQMMRAGVEPAEET